MDSKPENIVFSRNIHATLIDLSGIGGTTRKWLLPEMRSLPEPFSQCIEARKQNYIWTQGLIISAMAGATCNAMEHKVLSKVSLLATAKSPPRIPLRDTISILSSSLSALNKSEIAPVDAVRGHRNGHLDIISRTHGIIQGQLPKRTYPDRRVCLRAHYRIHLDNTTLLWYSHLLGCYYSYLHGVLFSLALSYNIYSITR